MTNKDRYRELCDNGASVPIFSKGWWLDAVCGPENWDVAVVEKGGAILGSLPYCLNSVFGAKVIRMPLLTQMMGPSIVYPPGQKYSRRLGYEHDILNGLIDQISEVAHFNQNFHYDLTNMLTFYWRGFELTPRYTYVFDDLSDLRRIWSNIREDTRNAIRRAQKSLQVRTGTKLDDFLRLNAQTFQRQGKKPSYSQDFVRALDAVCAKHEARKIFFAEDSEGHIHAAAYVVWDETTVHYLLNGSDPAVRIRGAYALVTWAAIEFAATAGKTFNFEGSMLKSVEPSIRTFGASQRLYLNVKRTKGLMKPLLAARAIISPLLGRQ